MTWASKKRVVLLQRVLPHYRISFVEKLRDRLEQYKVDLQLIYGQERPGTVPKTIELIEPWATQITNRYFDVPVGELVWQPCWKYLRQADLLIVEQANRLLVNYLLQLCWRNPERKLAFCGHGANFQAKSGAWFKNWLRCCTNNNVDWWFAYTRLSADIVCAAGFPNKQVTVIENSIDTKAFKQAVEAVKHEQILQLQEQLGLVSGPVALYCGAMYPDKQLPFLLEVADQLRKQISDFNFILVGSGPDQGLAEQAAATHSWIHYVGACYGEERAVYFALSDLILMPGSVGLVIIDSFVAGVPMVTTDIPFHGPEISYLENGKNGLMTAPTVADFATTVAACLSDAELLATLRDGCIESSHRYTLNAMVDNYVDGILANLAN